MLGISRRTARKRKAHQLSIAWDRVRGDHEKVGALHARLGVENARDRQNEHQGQGQKQPFSKAESPLTGTVPPPGGHFNFAQALFTGRFSTHYCQGGTMGAFQPPIT